LGSIENVVGAGSGDGTSTHTFDAKEGRLAPSAEWITKTRRTRRGQSTIIDETVIKEPFGTVCRVSSGTYSVTRQAFVSALAPTAGSGRFGDTIIASSKEETVLGVGSREKSNKKCQKEKSSGGEHPCVRFFLRRKREGEERSRGEAREGKGGLRGRMLATAE